GLYLLADVHVTWQVLAPARGQRTVDLDMELQAVSTRAYAEGLVRIQRAAGQQRRAAWQIERFGMPVDDQQLREPARAEHRVAESVIGQHHRAGANLVEASAVHRGAERGREQLCAEAYAQQR